MITFSIDVFIRYLAKKGKNILKSSEITEHWILAALLSASNSSEKALGKISRTRQIKICANDMTVIADSETFYA